MSHLSVDRTYCGSLLLALAVTLAHAPALASQPTPPVTTEIAAEPAGQANAVIAVLTLTANIEVGKAVLSF